MYLYSRVLEQCPDVELADLQDLVRKNLSLVVRDYYGERVSPCRRLQEYHPEVVFVILSFPS